MSKMACEDGAGRDFSTRYARMYGRIVAPKAENRSTLIQGGLASSDDKRTAAQ
jgi:hypothetical protein